MVIAAQPGERHCDRGADGSRAEDRGTLRGALQDGTVRKGATEEHAAQVERRVLWIRRCPAGSEQHRSEKHLGDAVYANMILLGMAWQAGQVPVSLDALDRAIGLNEVTVDANRLALTLGRCLVAAPDRIETIAAPVEDTLEQMIDRRAAHLADYQNTRLADAYRTRIAAVRHALPFASDALLRSVARNLFRVMSPKDEYEVARLLTSQRFRDELTDQFSLTATEGLVITAINPDSEAASKGLLEGEFDHLPEQAFYMVGNMEEAIEKAKNL